MTATADLIRQSMERNKFTQTELAIRLGWQTPAFICNVLRGNALLPPQRFRRFAKVTGTDLQQVIDAHMVDKRARVLREAGIRG